MENQITQILVAES